MSGEIVVRSACERRIGPHPREPTSAEVDQSQLAPSRHDGQRTRTKLRLGHEPSAPRRVPEGFDERAVRVLGDVEHTELASRSVESIARFSSEEERVVLGRMDATPGVPHAPDE